MNLPRTNFIICRPDPKPIKLAKAITHIYTDKTIALIYCDFCKLNLLL